MIMFEFFKKKFKKPAEIKENLEDPKKSTVKATKTTKSAKELATERNEPYVAVLGMEIDPKNMHEGSFELDWNDKFITNLVRAGYQGKTDADLVDQWFQNVCRNVVLETWEQEQANTGQRFTRSRDLGDGRTEVS
jgi:hypothetical protein